MPAISNYTDLKTEVADWLHQDNLTLKIPLFIQMGESFLNSKLRTVDQETRTVQAADTVDRVIALPTGFIEMKSVFIKNPVSEINYVPASQIWNHVFSDTNVAMPRLYTVKDGNIEFDSVSDSAYNIELFYYKKYDIATDTTNWLLDNHPSLYLYSAIAAAEIYLVNDARVSGIKALMAEEIEQINRVESRKRGSGVNLIGTEVASMIGNGSFNILYG